jgi:hypothetical protein
LGLLILRVCRAEESYFCSAGFISGVATICGHNPTNQRSAAILILEKVAILDLLSALLGELKFSILRLFSAGDYVVISASHFQAT